MADVMTAEQRSRVMSRNKAKDTSPEIYLNALLEATGMVFVRHKASLPGKPDFVFEESRVAVFVDGDFWHGWRFPAWSHRLAPFWYEKIAATRHRDQRNFRKLRRSRWTVIRIWEHQIETNITECVRRIVEMVGQDVDWSAIHSRCEDLPALKRRKRLPKP